MKIIVLGVPHTKTTRECCICPFTMKAWSQCRMFHRRGHEVIHLGVEGSDPECSENVVVVSGEEWKRVFQRPASRSRQEEGRKRAGDAIDVHGTQQRSPGIQTYAERWTKAVRDAISARCIRPWEAIVCCTWGDAQIAATKGLKQFVVESGIGYRQTWTKYRVFVSYAWLHFHLGKEGRLAGNAWYDVVIPNAVDPACFDFRPNDKRADFLYLGRLNNDKGVAIAIDVAKRTGRQITIVGPGDPARFLKGNPHTRYLPAVDVEGRRKLLAEAAALLCPTRYVEPLGNVALEAQISGTPVISTDWGGFTETVLHGVTGYRCRTMDQFVWAAKNIERINPAACRQWVIENYHPDRIGLMFDEYFQTLMDLGNDGWYQARPDRRQLDWLEKRYPSQ